MGASNKSNDPSCALQEFTNSNGVVEEAGVLVFSGRGNVWRMILENNHASTVVFYQFFNAASLAAVTVGTTAPVQTYSIPGGSRLVLDPIDFPIHWYSKGCVVACTNARTDNTAPAADGNVIIWYQN